MPNEKAIDFSLDVAPQLKKREVSYIKKEKSALNKNEFLKH